MHLGTTFDLFLEVLFCSVRYRIYIHWHDSLIELEIEWNIWWKIRQERTTARKRRSRERRLTVYSRIIIWVQPPVSRNFQHSLSLVSTLGINRQATDNCVFTALNIRNTTLCTHVMSELWRVIGCATAVTRTCPCVPNSFRLWSYSICMITDESFSRGIPLRKENIKEE